MNDRRFEVYQYEVGILLDKEDPEYDCYNQVWDFKNGYYNEDWGFFSTYKEAKEYIRNYIKSGCIKTYGIILKINVDEETYIDVCTRNTECIEQEYELNSVVYSAYKNDDEKIKEDFIDKNNFIEEKDEESEEI